jgi:hypothetical protein
MLERARELSQETFCWRQAALARRSVDLARNAGAMHRLTPVYHVILWVLDAAMAAEETA